MEERNAFVRIDLKTRTLLRLVGAVTEETMKDIVCRLAREEWARVEEGLDEDEHNQSAKEQ